jgi:16S rRNA (guanine527-N7)-methyltransferase
MNTKSTPPHRPAPTKNRFTDPPPRRSAEAPRRPGMVSEIPAAQFPVIQAQLVADLGALDLPQSPAQIAQLMAFLNHLLKWNALINISAVTEPADMLSVHIVDSLTALPVLRQIRLGESQSFTVLDVGTGPGIPAVPWAIAQPQLRIHAIDSVRKKIDTMTDFIETQALTNLLEDHARIEDLRGEYDVVTSRAFSSLKNFVTLAGSRVRGGGAMLALKGKAPGEEIAELEGTGWGVEAIVPIAVPRLDAERCAVILRRGAGGTLHTQPAQPTPT